MRERIALPIVQHLLKSLQGCACAGLCLSEAEWYLRKELKKSSRRAHSCAQSLAPSCQMRRADESDQMRCREARKATSADYNIQLWDLGTRHQNVALSVVGESEKVEASVRPTDDLQSTAEQQIAAECPWRCPSHVGDRLK